MQLSFNKLKTFNDCALKYRLAYIERLPRPPIKSLAFHRKLHAALAKYHIFARRDGVVRLDELLKANEEIWQVAREPEIRKTKPFQEAEEVLRLYWEVEQARARVAAFTEHKATVHFGPYTLTGVIDRIDFTNTDGYSVIDYKLDREMPRVNRADGSPQLSFYHLLVKEALGVEPEDVRLYYLRHGVEQVSTRSRDQMRQTVEWIDETASNIQQEKRWLPCEGDACRTCPFWSHCPAKTGRERPNEPVWRQGELQLAG